MLDLNISEYLPPKIEHYFSAIIGEYIYKIYNYRNKLINREEMTEAMYNFIYFISTNHFSRIHQADLDEKLTAFSKKYIVDVFTLKFSKIISVKKIL